MKEHPILFSTPMVQAIIAGRKTMTRRKLKVKGCKPFSPKPEEWTISEIEKWNEGYFPYGQVGDVLWVRETFKPADIPEETGLYEFKASLQDPDACWNKGIWKPSIHMPKSAARIWLKITNIKVERLQDISEEDAMNEGVEYEWYDQSRNIKIEAAKSLFKKLWQVINGRESWEANPWVWAIEFEVISTTGKPSEL